MKITPNLYIEEKTNLIHNISQNICIQEKKKSLLYFNKSKYAQCSSIPISIVNPI